MQNLTKPAIAIALLAAIGISCYTWGEHTKTQVGPLPQAVVTPSMQGVNPAVNQGTEGMPATANAQPGGPRLPAVGAGNMPGGNIPGGNMTPPATAPAVGSQNWQVQGAPPTAAQPVLNPTGPATAATTTTTITKEGQTTEEQTVTTRPHTAYARRVAHYKHHKTDKVHVARATKHGVMFALKLPGRMAF